MGRPKVRSAPMVTAHNGLTRLQKAVVGKTRPMVSRVTTGLDVPSTPADAADDANASCASKQGIQHGIVGPTLVGGKNF